jgi:predicted RNA-binding Zn-ribbon protein involved in translation (DUF1610 family)
VISEIKDDTTYHRGLGSAGQVIEHVQHPCPRCGHDETIRSIGVNIDARQDVEYWCLNPNCPYFVSDELSWATTGNPTAYRDRRVVESSEKPHPQMIPDTPMKWRQTAFCPDCEERHTVTVERDSMEHHEIANSEGAPEASSRSEDWRDGNPSIAEIKNQDNEPFEWYCDACMESERVRGDA